jgi:hypothetical protein
MTVRPDSEIDAAILSVASERWQKVAMVIELVAPPGESNHGDYDQVAERILALVEQGQLESAGDVMRWRHSEVRLKKRRFDA